MADSDWFAQALAFHRRGDFERAAGLYRQGLLADPANVRALDMLGVLELQRGRFADGVQALEAALRLSPRRAPPLSNLGVGLLKMGLTDAALQAFDQAVSADETYAKAHGNRGDALNRLGRFDEALTACNTALALDPGSLEARCNRAVALTGLHRYGEALSGYDAAIARHPSAAELYNNRGNVLKALCRFDDALADFDRATALAPGFVEAYVNRGIVLRELGRLDEAAAQYRQALTLNPDHAGAHWHSSLLALLVGDYDAGWREYEWRWRCPPLDRFARSFGAPPWKGLAAQNTVFVYAEQGLGDAIQFSRYLPEVARRAGRTIVEAPASLLPLLSTLDGDFRFIAAGSDLPAFDAQCAMMSLPLTLGIDIPVTPYLKPDPVRRAAWAARLGRKTRPRIGLCWAGNPVHANDARRSIPLAQLAPLLQLPFEFHAVGKAVAAGSVIEPHADELADFADTAALMAEMDLTISVDTAVAHAAGALGLPVWILLPHMPDWRWLLNRSDCPWYPTARLFRQAAAGDWAGVVADVVRAACGCFSRWSVFYGGINRHLLRTAGRE